MLEEFFNSGLINKWRFLLNYYRLINLNEEQLIVMLIIMNNCSHNKKIITPLEIASYSNFNEKHVEGILDVLQQGGFLNINENNQVSLNLSVIFNKIVVALENQSEFFVQDEIYKKLEYVLGPLTEYQINVFQKFLDNSISNVKILIILYDINDNITFNELVSLLKQYTKSSPKSLTKYNWLND